MVSPIGLGLAALGRPGYINLGRGTDLGHLRSVEAMEARAFEVLDAAWQGGVRYFDAARSYGRAEAFLGRWLEDRGINRDDVTVGSKWGYTYTADWRIDAETHEVKEHSLAVLRRQWLETRERLGDRLALYQVHSLTVESSLFEDGPLLADLNHLKRGGVRIGLTTSGSRQAEAIFRALEVEVEGSRLFDSVQATWNLLERSAAPALEEAHAAGLGVIVKEALANGRLTARNSAADFADRRAQLEAQASRVGATIDALALAAALAQPWADVVLSGAITAGQLRSNLRALEVRWDDDAEAQLGALGEHPDEYWSRRAALPWS